MPQCSVVLLGNPKCVLEKHSQEADLALLRDLVAFLFIRNVLDDRIGLLRQPMHDFFIPFATNSSLNEDSEFTDSTVDKHGSSSPYPVAWNTNVNDGDGDSGFIDVRSVCVLDEKRDVPYNTRRKCLLISLIKLSSPATVHITWSEILPRKSMVQS